MLVSRQSINLVFRQNCYHKQSSSDGEDVAVPKVRRMEKRFDFVSDSSSPPTASYLGAR